MIKQITVALLFVILAIEPLLADASIKLVTKEIHRAYSSKLAE